MINFGSIWLYFTATFLNWYGATSIFLFLVLAASTALDENHRLSPKLRGIKENRQVMMSIFAATYVYANFHSFDEMRRQRDDALSQISSGQLTTDELAKLAKNLPTSVVGLKVGQLWNDNGIIAITQP